MKFSLCHKCLVITPAGLPEEGRTIVTAGGAEVPAINWNKCQCGACAIGYMPSGTLAGMADNAIAITGPMTVLAIINTDWEVMKKGAGAQQRLMTQVHVLLRTDSTIIDLDADPDAEATPTVAPTHVHIANNATTGQGLVRLMAESISFVTIQDIPKDGSPLPPPRIIARPTWEGNYRPVDAATNVGVVAS